MPNSPPSQKLHDAERFPNERISLSLLIVGLAGPAHAGSGGIRRAPRAVPDEYIVVLKPLDLPIPARHEAVIAVRDDLVKVHGGTSLSTYTHGFQGFAIKATEGQVTGISHDPRVEWVEQNGIMELAGSTLSWGLDRIDNRTDPRLDGNYNNDGCNQGAGVFVYVMDSGIWAGHNEFANLDPLWGWPRVEVGFDALEGNHGRTIDPRDCGVDGQLNKSNFEIYSGSHGTGVASVIGGDTLGVARVVILRPIIISKCDGFTNWRAAGDAMEWILASPQNPHPLFGYDPKYGGQPRIINMSFSGDPNNEYVNSFEISIQTAISQHNITVVTAAGNQLQDAGLFTPGRVDGVINVGGSKGDQSWDVDSIWDNGPDAGNPGSNWGPNLTLFAPAQYVRVAHYSGTDAVRTKFNTGTSFSAPLAAGVAARWLEWAPTWTPGEVRWQLSTDATTGVISGLTGPYSTSPNSLLYKATVSCHPRICCSQ